MQKGRFDGILRLATGLLLLPFAISLAVGFTLGLPGTATSGAGGLTPLESDLAFLSFVAAMTAFGAWELRAGAKAVLSRAETRRT